MNLKTKRNLMEVYETNYYNCMEDIHKKKNEIEQINIEIHNIIKSKRNKLIMNDINQKQVTYYQLDRMQSSEELWGILYNGNPERIKNPRAISACKEEIIWKNQIPSATNARKKNINPNHKNKMLVFRANQRKVTKPNIKNKPTKNIKTK